ncbi:MAG: hypothetical protein J2P18_20220, partial [Nocardia sp.]|nr:hypothetical protein [Nocardia sp.]
MSWNRYSNIELPPELPPWVMEIAGGHFAQAHDGTMLWAGDQLHSHAPEWHELHSDLAAIVDRLGEFSGESIDQMISQGRQLQQVPDDLAKAYESQGRQLDSGGTDMRENKIVVIVGAVELAAQAGALLVSAAVNPVAGALEAAGEEAAWRVSMRVARDKLLDALLAKGARAAAERRGLLLPFEAGMGAVQGVVPQLVGMAVTNDWKPEQLADSALIGAETGVVGGLIGTKVGETAGRAIAKSSVSGVRRKALVAGTALTSSVLGGGAGGAAAAATSKLAQRKKPTLGDLVSGIESGAAAGAVFGAGGVITGLRTPSGAVPFDPRTVLAGKTDYEIEKLMGPRTDDVAPMTSAKLREYRSGSGNSSGGDQSRSAEAQKGARVLDKSSARVGTGRRGGDVSDGSKRPGELGDGGRRTRKLGPQPEKGVLGGSHHDGGGAHPRVRQFGKEGGTSGVGGKVSPPIRPGDVQPPIDRAEPSVDGQDSRNNAETDPNAHDAHEKTPDSGTNADGSSEHGSPESHPPGNGVPDTDGSNGDGHESTWGTEHSGDHDPSDPDAAERAQWKTETDQWHEAYTTFDDNFGAMSKEALQDWLTGADSTD